MSRFLIGLHFSLTVFESLFENHLQLPHPADQVGHPIREPDSMPTPQLRRRKIPESLVKLIKSIMCLSLSLMCKGFLSASHRVFSSWLSSPNNKVFKWTQRQWDA
ncbi:hypothetical protein EPI10_007508 [Gossypium australe]|uniref:Uncharacterized protein n=1 Tax=Gossypium australe TaxID=47621 RepID=A0A5B6WVP8_9ROSI|nr:hypothetical protein EPI10_007508 [Gossypium australe]